MVRQQHWFMSARNQNPSTPTSSESDIEARYAKKSPLQALDGNGEGGGEKKKIVCREGGGVRIVGFEIFGKCEQ